MTPVEAFQGRKPTIGHFRKLGETAYVFTPLEKRPPGTKLAPRAQEGKICGYGDHTDEYWGFLPSSKKVIRSGDVRFELPTPTPKHGG